MLLALKDSEMRYRRLFESAQDGILILDAGTGMITDVNPYLIRMLGYSREEFVERKLWQVGAFKDIQANRQAFEALQQNQYIRYEDLPLKAKDGRLVEVEFVSNVYMVNDEKVIQCNIRDITARKEAERLAAKSQERYRATLNNMMEACQIIDYDWRYLYVNEIAAKQGRKTPPELLMHTMMEVYPGIESTNLFHKMQLVMENRAPQRIENQFFFGDGAFGWFELSIQPVPEGIFILSIDITERKRTEEALRESERHFRNLLDNSPDVIYVLDLVEHRPLFFNRQEFCGYSRQELETSNSILAAVHPDEQGAVSAHWQLLLTSDLAEAPMIEYRLRRKDGNWEWLENREVILERDKHNRPTQILVTLTLITARKQAEKALRESEEKYRRIIETAQEGIWTIDSAGQTMLANRRLADMFGYTVEEMIGKSIYEFLDDEGKTIAPVALQNRRQGVSKQLDFKFKRKDGSAIWTLIETSTLLDQNQQYMGALAMLTDITERKRAEEALQESAAKFRSYIEHAPLGVFVVDRLGRYTEVNTAAARMLGYTEAELLQLSIADILAPQSLQAGLQHFQMVVQDGFATSEFLFRRRDGNQFWATVDAVRLGEDRFMAYSQDISGRKQAEEKLSRSHEFLQSVQDALSAHIAILDDAGNIVQVNSAWRDFGARNGLQHSNHCIGTNYLEICDSAQGLYAGEASLVADAIRQVGNGRKDEMWVEYPCHAPAEQRWFIVRITGFENNKRTWVVVAHENITERKSAEIRIRRQLEHLIALSAIDRVIAANFDLKLILSEIMTYLTAELGVDAADVLILNSQMLEYGAETGFRTKAASRAEVYLSNSYAGRAALERQLVHIPNLGDAPENPSLVPHWAGEGFACYYGVPLIAKGQVKGVLEVFHRAALTPDAEWFDFLNTLAGQAALAIENAALFGSLQRSNLELMMAYDATIEGWSRALDLRDEETEGHSLRVTEMTLKLARAFGLSDAELAQARWGALLHDIGKMGVPDGILLKPGPLTDEEWVKMKKHPTFAYEMLLPIAYLRQALDIPHCHHEKWDGSGYPQGLKGNQIPLAARIFAVVDVWDALSSDRPYRPAWTKERVLEHIRASAGTHFDPQVVDVFMQMPN